MRRQMVSFLLALVIYFTTECLIGAQVCHPPDFPLGGAYVPKKAKYLPGDDVIYTCKDEFILTGQERRICISGKWSSYAPFCDSLTRIKNPHASSDRTGKVDSITDGNPRTCYSTPVSTSEWVQVYLDRPAVVHSVRLYLQRGAVKIRVSVLSDSLKKMCTAYERVIENGQWVLLKCLGNQTTADAVRIENVADKASSITICEIQVYTMDDYWCERPPMYVVRDGYFEISRNRATLHCKEGFSGEDTRFVCERNLWKGSNARCEEILCGAEVNNNSLSDRDEWYMIGKVSKLSAGVKRRLKCETGFKVQGTPDIVTCFKNGSWTYTTAICVAIVEKKSLKTIVIAAVGAVVLIIIFALLGVMVYLIQKKRAREVVVVFKPGSDGSVTTASELEYASPSYYETINAPPILPSTPRPPMTPPIKLNEGEYLLPEDDKMISKTSTLPADIAFGTLKESTLYSKYRT